jgi:hypothetical protein
MSGKELSSKQFEVSEDDAIEFFFQKGWTDGLPVVPPTERRVGDFLEVAGRDPSDIVGTVPARGRVITVEKIAINSVMAGCRPEYMPVILAAIEAMTDPVHNLHGAAATTAGPAELLLINGPIRHKLGFNSKHNVLGPGNRANATVGRAIRLILMNVCGSIPGALDKASLGHSGKFSYCIAEDEEGSPWQPFHADRGFDPQDSTVTVFAAMAPWQTSHAFTRKPEAVLSTLADVAVATGLGNTEILVLIPPELLDHLARAGWSKERCQRFLHDAARRPTSELIAKWRLDPTEAPSEDMVSACRDPESIYFVPAGGSGGVWAAVVPMWSRGLHSKSVTCKIDVTNI